LAFFIFVFEVIKMIVEKETGVDENGKRFVREVLEYDEEQISNILHRGFNLPKVVKKSCIIFIKVMC